MKTLKRNSGTLVGCVLCFLLFWPTESNAQLKEMSAEELTLESTAILYGKCSKVSCEWNATKDIILTHVTIVPEEYVKGNLGAEAILTIPGGRVGDIVYEVSEMPVFIEGEEVFAFAWKHPSGKNLVLGGQHGKLKIEKDKQTGKRMVNKKILEEEGESDSLEKDYQRPPKFRKILLEDYVSEVRQYMNQ
jgi:hypothetical protein